MERETYDAFSACHPAVNFVYFVGVICFGAVIQHPAYLLAGAVGGAMYYLLLRGRRGWRLILGLMPVFLVVSGINPLFNTYGERVLFTLFGRPYTLEALLYGMAIAGIFVVMALWFGCYSAVMTSDKFTSLFGSVIPALSLLLVMVLRMIPNLLRKGRQIAAARNAVGMGLQGKTTLREKLLHGMTLLSALTDWALEGSVITSDSMRARGYGAARRTSFQIYRMSPRDWALLGLTLALAGAVLAAGGTAAEYAPALSIAPLGWGFPIYCLYLLIPSALHGKESLQWRISISKI